MSTTTQSEKEKAMTQNQQITRLDIEGKFEGWMDQRIDQALSGRISPRTISDEEYREKADDAANREDSTAALRHRFDFEIVRALHARGVLVAGQSVRAEPAAPQATERPADGAGSARG